MATSTKKASVSSKFSVMIKISKVNNSRIFVSLLFLFCSAQIAMSQLETTIDFDDRDVAFRTDFSNERDLRRAYVKVRGRRFDSSLNFSSCSELENLHIKIESPEGKIPGEGREILSHLTNCNSLGSLTITGPCAVDLSKLAESCPNLWTLYLIDCSSSEKLSLPESLQVVTLTNCNFNAYDLWPPLLRNLTIRSSNVSSSNKFPARLKHLEIEGSGFEILPELPVCIKDLRVYGTADKRIRVNERYPLDFLTWLVFEHVNIENFPLDVKSANKLRVKLIECEFGEDFKIMGQFRDLELRGRESGEVKDLSDHFGPIVIQTECEIAGYAINSRVLEMIARSAKNLHVEHLIDSPFPDLSDSKLRSLRIMKMLDFSEFTRTLLPPEMESFYITGIQTTKEYNWRGC